MSGTWAFPYGIDGTGRTARTDPDAHVRDMIEQVLFTTPGERVMRPDFGSGLMALVFQPGGTEIAATTRYLVQAALERWLSDVITVESVAVDAAGAALVVTVTYTVLRTGVQQAARFPVPGAPA